MLSPSHNLPGQSTVRSPQPSESSQPASQPARGESPLNHCHPQKDPKLSLPPSLTKSPEKVPRLFFYLIRAPATRVQPTNPPNVQHPIPALPCLGRIRANGKHSAAHRSSSPKQTTAKHKHSTGPYHISSTLTVTLRKPTQAHWPTASPSSIRRHLLFKYTDGHLHPRVDSTTQILPVHFSTAARGHPLAPPPPNSVHLPTISLPLRWPSSIWPSLIYYCKQ